MSDFTWENGPIRQIPGTQALAQQAADAVPTSPSGCGCRPWSAPAPASAVFRDNRAWHGATPNLSREIRAMPNVEYGAPWLDPTPFKGTMPHEIWEGLSDHAKALALAVKTEPGVWPAGAGVMHPLLSSRRKAKEAARAAP